MKQLLSGKKNQDASADSAGAAVSLRISSALNRYNAVQAGLLNAMSYKQLQDDSLSELGDLITRLGEIKLLSMDPTKSGYDLRNYNVEYEQICAEARKINDRTFNGIRLFSPNLSDQTLNTLSREDGSQFIGLSQPTMSVKDLIDILCDKTFTVVNSTSTKVDVASGMPALNDYEWQAAQLDAARHPYGRLACLPTQNEWDMVKLELGTPPFADPLWIGLTQATGSGSVSEGWRWISGEKVTSLNQQYWVSGEPDNGGISEPAGPTSASALVFNQPKELCDVYGHTGDEDPSAHYGYVLQYTDNISGATIYKPMQGRFTWDEARMDAYAQSLGRNSYLATPISQGEFDSMKSQLAAQHVGTNDMYWLGGYQDSAYNSATEADPKARWFWVSDVKSGDGLTHPNSTSIVAPNGLILSVVINAQAFPQGATGIDVSSDVTNLLPGMGVSGAGIDAGTTITGATPANIPTSPANIGLSKGTLAVSSGQVLVANSDLVEVASDTSWATNRRVFETPPSIVSHSCPPSSRHKNFIRMPLTEGKTSSYTNHKLKYFTCLEFMMRATLRAFWNSRKFSKTDPRKSGHESNGNALLQHR